MVTESMALIAVPKSLSLLYGLITDNVPLFGSYRKSWLILNLGCSAVIISLAAFFNE